MNLLPPLPSCIRCSLHDQGTGVPASVGIPSRHLPGCLPPTPSSPLLVYVGRNPGANEDASNTCFIGRSGALLEKVYIDGIDARSRASIVLTNAARCFTVANAPPPPAAYSACSRHLHADLSTLLHHHEPAPLRLVVLLGGESVKYVHERLLGIKGMSLKKAMAEQLRVHEHLVDQSVDLPKGTPRPRIPVPPFQIVSMYHPSFILRNPNAIHATAGHNQIVLDALLGLSSPASSPRIQPPRLPSP